MYIKGLIAVNVSFNFIHDHNMDNVVCQHEFQIMVRTVVHLAVTLIWRFGNFDENCQIKITANLAASLTCNQLYI